MTIKKQWLLVLAAVAIVSVMVHALFINVLTDKTFRSYLTENYQHHVKEIENYAEKVLASPLSTQEYSLDQMAMELQTHLDEPITRIQLFDKMGHLLIDVAAEPVGRMHNNMRDRMMGIDAEGTDVTEIQLVKNGAQVGTIHVTHYASITQSLQASRFQEEMMSNTIWSVALVVLLALLIGYYISRRMSKDLMSTASFAERLDEGEDQVIRASSVSEVRRIQQSLLSLRQKLRLKQQVRKTMLDELVHQTRTPLTIMKTRLEGLEDGVIPFSVEEAKVMGHQVDSLTELLANVTRLIDATGEAYPLNVESVDLTALLNRIYLGLKPQFERKGIVLDMAVSTVGHVLTDAHLLSQVLYNILMNAYKYTDVGGQVSLGCVRDGEWFMFTVTDSGRGISAADLPNVFDAYYRGGQTENVDGDGLGLFVAKQNMARLGGTIEVQSEVGVGTTFVVQLPV